ncbi:Acetyl-CoA hydrolase/transferase [Oesophagostomum dentatum]|uniref:Acetyl-CoA hydrolase/transferase n=1 Tax=Oesophagostomum dentatum TaxID=61180 RepID=A0A0B1TMG0_OESDE|nr:Acetyl-CoA hydrolase/transferase [Oesophagostomum dentatum]
MRWSAALRQTLMPVSSRLSTPVIGRIPKRVTADEAVNIINSNSSIYVHTQASTPTELLEALCKRVDLHGLTDIRMMHVILSGNVPWTDKRFIGKIRSNSMFLDSSTRPLVKQGFADYIPIFLSDITTFFRNKTFPLDYALISVTPPGQFLLIILSIDPRFYKILDKLGYCTIGVNVDTSLSAIESAKKIIAVVNPNMPRTFGNTIIHQSRIESVVEVNREIYGKPEGLRITELSLFQEEKKIGELIAENLVEDGATLQLGIGAIPDSTLLAMKNHKDLGIHTELLGDGVMDLIERGVINNSRKSVMPGKERDKELFEAVTSFAFGTQKFYKFLDNNPLIHFDCCSWTNDEGVIRANSRMTCINSGIEVDITGQVVADSIGEMFYSGFGGQVQFINAAATAHDGKGKAIIAMTSRTNKGKSKITTTLTEVLLCL